MVPGINTTIAHGAVEYHVQTEDLGSKNPTILTLVYRSGAVVLRDKLEYGQILAADTPPSLIRTLMDAQHRRILRRVADGEIDPGSVPQEEPSVVAPQKTVDDLIEEYLCTRRLARSGATVRGSSS